MLAGGESRAHDTLRDRVLILAPVGRDAALAAGLLQREQLRCEICPDVPGLIRALRHGAGTAVIADEALKDDFNQLQDWVGSQPAWSDFPFIILTGSKAPAGKMQERFKLMRPLGNITLLERPLRSITLLSVVHAALRARSRQYEVEHYIQEMRQAEMERAQAYAREEAAEARIELLNHISSILSAEFHLDSLLPAILDAGTGLSGADVGIFFLESFVEGARKFALRCTSGMPAAEVAAVLNDLALIEESQVAWKKLSRWPGGEDDKPADRASWMPEVAKKLCLENCVALPVASRPEAVIGVLFFGRYAREPFSRRDESIASSLASQAAIAIDNARLFTVAQQERRRLEAAREMLQRSNDELRQFAYVASHDLQEPLRTVASFAQLLVGRANQKDPQSVEFAAFIVEGVERMNSLIRGLLQYSSTGASNALPAQPCAAEASLAQALFSLSASIQETGATITHDSLPEIWMDDRSLTLLLQNLIGNAIKYRGNKPPRIHVTAQETGGAWHFRIRDNGIGIAPEYHEQIFGIFKRLHGKEVPGTGIGLAICQRIVQWHGGNIWVESEPGSGSVFHFTVPAERRRIHREMAEMVSRQSW